MPRLNKYVRKDSLSLIINFFLYISRIGMRMRNSIQAVFTFAVFFTRKSGIEAFTILLLALRFTTVAPFAIGDMHILKGRIVPGFGLSSRSLNLLDFTCLIAALVTSTLLRA
jgi:hypothetical protein